MRAEHSCNHIILRFATPATNHRPPYHRLQRHETVTTDERHERPFSLAQRKGQQLYIRRTSAVLRFAHSLTIYNCTTAEPLPSPVHPAEARALAGTLARWAAIYPPAPPSPRRPATVRISTSRALARRRTATSRLSLETPSSMRLMPSCACAVVLPRCDERPRNRPATRVLSSASSSVDAGELQRNCGVGERTPHRAPARGERATGGRRERQRERERERARMQGCEADIRVRAFTSSDRGSEHRSSPPRTPPTLYPIRRPTRSPIRRPSRRWRGPANGGRGARGG